MQSSVEHVPTIADVRTRASREEGKILLTEIALLTEVRRQDRRTMAMAAGSTSLSSLLVAAHELSPSGQNWTAQTRVVLPHYSYDN